MTELQLSIYQKIIAKKSREISQDEKFGVAALPFITNLKKLCNHPQLIYNICKNREPGFEGSFVLYI